MATTLEDFVAKLHAEGVESGRAEAERLTADARERAREILADAEGEARRIIEQAEARAQELLRQEQAELALAARDAVLNLRAGLTRSLETLLRRAAAPALHDPALVGDLLRLLVTEYVRADARGAQHIEIVVPPQLKERLELDQLHALARSLGGGACEVDVKGELAEAGFEYRVADGRIEVTLDAVVEVLKGLLRPALWAVLDAARAEGDRGPAAAPAPPPAG